MTTFIYNQIARIMDLDSVLNDDAYDQPQPIDRSDQESEISSNYQTIDRLEESDYIEIIRNLKADLEHKNEECELLRIQLDHYEKEVHFLNKEIEYLNHELNGIEDNPQVEDLYREEGEDEEQEQHEEEEEEEEEREETEVVREEREAVVEEAVEEKIIAGQENGKLEENNVPQDENQPVEPKDDETQLLKKKETMMLKSLKRRAELEAKRAIKENELAEQRKEAEIRRKAKERQKLEYKQRREAILEQYRQKKKAAESNETTNESTTPTPVTEVVEKDNCPAAGSLYSSSTNSASKSSWTLYTGPKLYAKLPNKSNLITIQNAILKALEGAANAKTLKKMQETIATHSKTCCHFMILFRNHHQFRGLYEYDEKKKNITKLDGIGPKTINNEDILKYYKFDSPKRQFTEVITKHISLTIIAVTIQEHLWSKPINSRSSHDLAQQQQKNGHH